MQILAKCQSYGYIDMCSFIRPYLWGSFHDKCQTDVRDPCVITWRIQRGQVKEDSIVKTIQIVVHGRKCDRRNDCTISGDP